MKKSYIPLLLILLIAIGTGVLDYFTPLAGDDLSKWLYMGGDKPTFPDRQAISFLGAQYFDTNGRVFDALGPLLTNLLPRGLASALMGLMAGLYFYALSLSSGVLRHRKTTLACCVVFAGLFLMPWYDSFFHRVCHFNYVWGVAFALLFMYEWFSEKAMTKGRLVWLFILGGLSGCFHEQIGVTMTFVFGLYVLITRCRDWHWVPLSGLAIGTLITIATPAIWNRASDAGVDSVCYELLLTTLPLVIVLLIVTGLILITRSRLREVVKSRPYLVCLSIAVVSSAIALYSTIPGRTGWLAESFSIVALAMLCKESRRKLSRGVSAMVISAIFILVIGHFYVSVSAQRKMSGEYQQAIELYRQSEDGVVRMAYTQRYEVSPLSLYRIKGLPDGDDTHLLRVFQMAYGSPNKPIILISPKFAMVDSIPGDIELLSNFIGDTICVRQTESGRLLYRKFSENGQEKILVEPLVVDPNDNWYPIK